MDTLYSFYGDRPFWLIMSLIGAAIIVLIGKLVTTTEHTFFAYCFIALAVVAAFPIYTLFTRYLFP